MVGAHYNNEMVESMTSVPVQPEINKLGFHGPSAWTFTWLHNWGVFAITKSGSPSKVSSHKTPRYWIHGTSGSIRSLKNSKNHHFLDLNRLKNLKKIRKIFLREVQPILSLKSMSERVGSDIKWIWIGICNRCWVDLEIHYSISESLYVGSDFFRHWFQK